MKLTSFFCAVALTIVALSLNCVGAQQEKKLNEQTMRNLSTAMHGEAFAYVKYLLYAEQARRSGNSKLADLLEKTAKTERFEHFAEEARLADTVGHNSANLKDAITGESYESETMYRDFAQQAEQAGDHQAAQRFEEIGKDEAKHRDAFTRALKELENGAPHRHN